jgi:hypothetical protein
VWLQESITSIEQFQREPTTVEQNLTKLTRLLQQIEASAILVAEVCTNSSERPIKLLIRLVRFLGCDRSPVTQHQEGQEEVRSEEEKVGQGRQRRPDDPVQHR